MASDITYSIMTKYVVTRKVTQDDGTQAVEVYGPYDDPSTGPVVTAALQRRDQYEAGALTPKASA